MVQWDRVVELWYPSFSAWRKAVIEEPPEYTAPEWATDDFYKDGCPTYPFLKPGVDFVEHVPARASRRRVPPRHPLLPPVNVDTPLPTRRRSS